VEIGTGVQTKILSKWKKYELRVSLIPREYLGHVMKLRRYNGLWNGNKERSHNNCCVGPQDLNLGCKVYAGERTIFSSHQIWKRSA
jgi:hypothetical protein